LENENNGVLEKMVASGLTAVLVGAERTPNDRMLYKGKNDKMIAFQNLFRQKYPDTLVYATFLIGIKGDGLHTLISHSLFALKMNFNYAMILFLIPYPGTLCCEELVRKKEICYDDYFQTTYSRDHMLHKFGSQHMKKHVYYAAGLHRRFLNYLLRAQKIEGGKHMVPTLAAVIYRNKYTLMFSLIIFFILTLPFFIVDIVHAPHTFFQWRKPRWYHK